MKDETNTETADKPQVAVSSTDWLDAQERFLDAHGDSFLFWRDGCVVIESYYEKQFLGMGGNVDRMIAYFEDYCNMHEASRHYIAAQRSASNEKVSDGAGEKR